MLLASIFEIGFTTFMKLSNGFTKWTYIIFFAICGMFSLGLLTLATRTIPLGTAYAVWTGIGAFGTAIVGMIFFKDPTTFWRVFFLTILISSIIGLKIVSKGA